MIICVKWKREEAAATLVVEAMVEKALRGLTSVPESEIPEIVIHDVTETADMLVKTTAGRNSLPAEILAGLRSKGMAGHNEKAAGAMGFVGADGAIHIFPGMHANALARLTAWRCCVPFSQGYRARCPVEFLVPSTKRLHTCFPSARSTPRIARGCLPLRRKRRSWLRKSSLPA